VIYTDHLLNYCSDSEICEVMLDWGCC